MLRFDGNTYTYLIYSVARCRGVIEKVESSGIAARENDFSVLTEYDIKLLRKIFSFPGVLAKTFNTQMPHHLCEYIHKLVSIFHEHYSNSRCIHCDSDENVTDYNQSRVSIYMLIKKILGTICDLLGLPIVDKI